MNAANELPVGEMVDLTTMQGGTPRLNAALAKCQGEIELAKKDSVNPHFNSKYADLASCREVARKPLSGNGLAVQQIPRMRLNEGLVEVTTTLLHASGEERCFGTVEMPVAQKTAHGVSSALTYARRAGFNTALGIAAEEDDDGNAASGKTEAPRAGPKPVPQKKSKTGEKVVTFGNNKGKAIEALTDAELAEALKLGDERVSSDPGALWAAGVTACLADLEVERSSRELEAKK